MREVKIRDISLDGGEMSSTVYTVELDGQVYKIDVWCTHNASGHEFYDEDDTPLFGGDIPDELSAWDFDEDDRVSQFWHRYNTEVGPRIERIKHDVFDR